jgi:hypothetical protein
VGAVSGPPRRPSTRVAGGTGAAAVGAGAGASAPSRGSTGSAASAGSGVEALEPVAGESQAEAESVGGGPGDGRPRLMLVVGLAVAAALVIVAVVAGGSSDPDPDAGAATSSSAAASTTTTTRRPTTTRVPVTVPPETQPTQPPTHEPWVPDAPGLELVMGGSDGQILRVDLATGRSRVVGTGLTLGQNPDATQVVAGRLLIPRFLGPTQLRFMDLLTGELVDIDVDDTQGGNCGIFRSDDPDRVWISRCDDIGRPRELVEYSFRERTPTATIALPEDHEGVLGYAPGLGAVLAAAGEIYLVDANGVTHVASGTVLGVVGDTVLRRECDAQLVCTVDLLDLSDGQARAVAVDPALGGDPQQIQYMPSASPAGPNALAWVQRPDRIGAIGVLDAEAGTVVPVADGRDVAPFEGDLPTWSPDGEWLFGRRRGDVWAYHVDDRRLVELDDMPGNQIIGVLQTG